MRVSEVGPAATAFWRVLLALPLLAVVAPRAPAAAAAGTTRLVVVAGLCFAGDLLAWHASIRFTSVANSTLFANGAPIFVTLAARPLFGERITRGFVLGLAVALVGAALVVGASLGGGDDAGRRVLGDALGVLTAVFYAGYQLAVKRLRDRLAPTAILLRAGLVTAAALLPATLLAGESLAVPGARGWLVLLGLAWVGHVLGQGLIAWALGHLPASFSSVALLWQPAAAAALAWLLLGETLGGANVAGGALLLVGIALARRASAQASPAVWSRPT